MMPDESEVFPEIVNNNWQETDNLQVPKINLINCILALVIGSLKVNIWSEWWFGDRNT